MGVGVGVGGGMGGWVGGNRQGSASARTTRAFVCIAPAHPCPRPYPRAGVRAHPHVRVCARAHGYLTAVPAVTSTEWMPEYADVSVPTPVLTPTRCSTSDSCT